MDAIVPAGGIPLPSDPLYTLTRGGATAMMEIAGKPMIQWVLDAIAGTSSVQRIIVIGLTPKLGLTCRKPLFFVPNQGPRMDNLRAGVRRALELDVNTQSLLYVAADAPAITAPMLDWFAKTCADTQADISYPVVERKTMQRAFPASKRTYAWLDGKQWCGGNVGTFRPRLVDKDAALLNRIFDTRKRPLAQARILGARIALNFVLRRLTTAEVLARLADQHGIRAQAIITPYAEMGMDVDKPEQFDQMQHHLTRAQSAATRRQFRTGKNAAQLKAGRKVARLGHTKPKKTAR